MMHKKSSRNCWGSARERHRMEARFRIRQRILSTTLPLTTPQSSLLQQQATVEVDDNDDGTLLATTRTSTAKPTITKKDDQNHHQQQNVDCCCSQKEDQLQQAQHTLKRIVANDRCYFSLRYMADNADFLSTPFAVSYLWEVARKESNNDNNNKTQCKTEQDLYSSVDFRNTLVKNDKNINALIGYEQLVSWFSLNGVLSFVDFLSSMHTCTFLEYTIWLKRYAITNQLLLGGISPSMRGLCKCRLLNNNKEQQTLSLLQLDSGNIKKYSTTEECKTSNRITVLQYFYNFNVPLSLQTYILMRVVNMRKKAVTNSSLWPLEQQQQQQKSCILCNSNALDATNVLVYDDDDDTNSSSINKQQQQRQQRQQNNHKCCNHEFCEDCFWTDLMKNLDTRENNVVECPVCNANKLVNNMQQHALSLENTSKTTLSSLIQSSKERFYNLPKFSSDLKISNIGVTKKNSKNPKGKCSLCSNWSDAIRPSLGFSQDVRREKFFTYVEKGSFQYVREILIQGMDVDVTNEYGHTGLYIAVWRQHVRLVELLLSSTLHARTNICANGNLSVFSLAKYLQNEKITKLLSPFSPTTNNNSEDIVTNSHHDNRNSADEYCPTPVLTTLISPCEEDHPGAGSYIIDQTLSTTEIDNLLELWKSLPVETSTKTSKGCCSNRSYYCDAENKISSYLRRALVQSGMCNEFDVEIHPHMRFLAYLKSNISLAPHVDLVRTHPFSGNRSTHTFILYLTTCENGGETTLLRNITSNNSTDVSINVSPVVGRLLLFTHNCPHEGKTVIDAPKILVRGETQLKSLPLQNKSAS